MNQQDALQQIFDWADKFDLSNEQIPRDETRLLAITELDMNRGGITNH